MRFNSLWLVLAVLAVAGCGSSGSDSDVRDLGNTPDVPSDVTDIFDAIDVSPDPTPPDAPAPDVTAELPTTSDLPDDSVGDLATDPGWETVSPPVPFGQENRGYKMLRGIVHLHSNLSHDGCYPQHEEVDASLLVDCETEHRAAPCLSGIDFLMQSDHPSNVRDATFEEALHFRSGEGDTLLNDSKGNLTANLVQCPKGSLVPSFMYFVGTEGSKQMPIGMSAPIPAEVWNTSYGDSTPLEATQAAIAKLHEIGGYAFVAHPEEDDLTVERIKAAPLDGIEIFNFHPMLMDALTSNITQFIRMDAFMTPGRANPDPDLAILLLLKPVANDPLKFDQAAPFIRLTGFGATDIHRNVEVPSLCTDLESCGDNWGETFPNFAQLLVTGGPPVLADGQRMDGFKRAFRWMSNHTLVATEKAAEVDEVRMSIGTGRSFMAFDVLGSPAGFDFFAVADGNTVEMGREIKGATSVDLYIRSPALELPAWGLPGVDQQACANSLVRTKVYHATSTGSELVLDQPGQGREFKLAGAAAGAYRVEVWVTPTHVKPALNGIEEIADIEVPYLYSNAIFVR